MSPQLRKGIDYYLDDKGMLVFTERYHRKRGYCCKSGCKHCPYGFRKKQKDIRRNESP